MYQSDEINAGARDNDEPLKFATSEFRERISGMTLQDGEEEEEERSVKHARGSLGIVTLASGGSVHQIVIWFRS